MSGPNPLQAQPGPPAETAFPQGLPELRPRYLRDRIAFVLFSHELLYHFEPVLKWLDPAEVDLIVYNPDDEERIIQRLEQLPFAWFRGRELIQQRIGYRLLISNHYGGFEDIGLTLANGARINYKGHPIRLLGVFNVRFMYGIGFDFWNLEDWNNLYEAFLCYGPYHVERLSPFRGLKLQMGYPRYDAFFTEPLTLAAKTDWLTRLGCDPAKPTLLWYLPLTPYYEGMDTFAAALSALRGSYNVVVKPHPHNDDRDNARFVAAHADSFTCLLTGGIDNVILFQLTDYVISGYGGTIYGALYTDKNLLLFDHPKYQGHAEPNLLNSDTDAWIRYHIAHLSAEQADQIPAMLSNQALWEQQKQIRAQLRALFFSPTYGHSAQLAARLIREMLRVALE